MIEQKILYRYFEGIASPEEVLSIKKWLDESAENMQLYLQERKLYDAVMMLEEPSEISSKQEFNYRKLFSEFAKIAAVGILVFTLSYFYFKSGTANVEELFQTISVPAGQRINMTLPDGTNVWLNARTTIKYPLTFNKDIRQIELNGEAYFEVVENKARPFVVQTSKGRLEVLGTVFNIEDYSDMADYETMLFEGAVKIVPADSLLQTVTLSPDYKASLCDGKWDVEKVDDYSVYRWREGLICFKDESFAKIMSDFEKYYGLKIVIENENVKARHYSGKFRQTDGIDYALRVLQKDIRFTYERDDERNNIYIK